MSNDDNVEENKKCPEKTPQYMAALTASFGALSVGTVLGYASPALYQLRESGAYVSDVTPHNNTQYSSYSLSNDSQTFVFNEEFRLTTSELPWFSAAFSIGAFIGGLICGPLMRVCGRRGTMILSSIPSTLGWCLLGFGVNFAMLVAGRIFTGMTTGIACAVVPIYIGEIATPALRGTLGISFQLMLGLGIVYVFSFGAILQWYFLALVCWLPAMLFSFLMIFQPESPTHHINKGKFDEAQQSLRRLRGDEYDISIEYEESVRASEAASKTQMSAKDISDPGIYKPVFIVLGIVALQQLCGINALSFNLATIFEKTGSGLSEAASSIICAVVQTVSVFPAGMLVDTKGRKILLLMSAAVMGLAHVFLGLYFYLLEIHETWTVTYIFWLPVLSVMLFLFGFSLGFGTVPWIILGEMFSISIRESAGSVSIAFNWAVSFVVIYSFEYIINQFSYFGFFLYFGAWCFIAFLFTLFFVKETKGKSLEEVANMFKK